jgi:tetratricopeptide (TPR) repeat protein
MRHFALFAVAAVLVFALSANSDQGVSSGNPSSASPQADTPAVAAKKKAVLRADILMARKEYAAAIDLYLEILKDYPHDAELLNKTGVAYQELGGLDSATAYYKRSEKYNKKLANPVNNLGTLEYSLKHYSKAVNYYKRAISLGAEEATVYGNLGYAYYSEKKFDLAMDAFNKALSIDPSVFENHGGTGGTTMQERSAPDPGMLNFFLAKSYAKTGDAARTAHFLKLARDYGYKDLLSAKKDPGFALVIKDSRVVDVLENRPSYSDDTAKPAATN